MVNFDILGEKAPPPKSATDYKLASFDKWSSYMSLVVEPRNIKKQW
jgi:hypothetical protein